MHMTSECLGAGIGAGINGRQPWMDYTPSIVLLLQGIQKFHLYHLYWSKHHNIKPTLPARDISLSHRIWIPIYIGQENMFDYVIRPL